ncbi:MAG: hypothetical protein AMJ41_01175 [candidate division Zixibacteria bacterium DG_27]|nr:MAG: hypothetical protein AMJ41_01175 [candidate division Zixibacteria bacterium DG_27]
MKKITVVGLAMLLTLSVSKVALSQAKVGTAGAQFLEIGVSARAVGMGEAFLANCDDASAVYYNPALIATLPQTEVMLTHIDYPADINYEFAALTLPVPQLLGALGFGVYYLSTDDMPLTDYTYPRGNGQTFTARDLAASFSYAASLTDRFSVGITLKYIGEYIEEEKAIGWGADVGTLYETGFRNFKICMMISNFGSDSKFSTAEDVTYEAESYPLPMDFKFGMAIDAVSNSSHRVVLAVQGSHPNDNLEKYNTGMEYWYNDMVALRIGNRFEDDAGGGFTAGAGAKIPLSGVTLRADYGYHDFGWLKEVHRFSLGFSF